MKDEIEKQIFMKFAAQRMKEYLEADPITAWSMIDSLIMYIDLYEKKAKNYE